MGALEKRRGSVQQLKIERINLNDGAQAIVGNINQQEGKNIFKSNGYKGLNHINNFFRERRFEYEKSKEKFKITPL